MSLDHLKSEFADHLMVATATPSAVAAPFERLVEASAMALESGNKILLFGNGGSAADAQHIASELVVRLRRKRPALAALALTTDSSMLTAIGNDYGFEHVFARQLEANSRPGDVAIGISTSGGSANVLLGLERAKALGLTASGLAGGTGGKMVGLAEPLLIVPSSVTARIQEMHILIGHALCGTIEKRLGFGPP